MTFYSTIAPYYDYVFPANPSQIKFLKEIIGEGPKQVLDIACGNGSYAMALSKEGYIITALDSDKDMIETAKSKADLEEISIGLVNCSMEEIKSCIEGKFDAVYCIGNSIVHLESKEKINKFLKDIHSMLNKGGKAIVQMINYDRIIKHGVTKLPDISHEPIGLKFLRSYRLAEDKKSISFDTTFSLKEKKQEHSVLLVPLLKDELIKLSKEAGFKVEGCYGDFEKSVFNEDESYHCIVVLEV